jgi:hypothetical protein
MHNYVLMFLFFFSPNCRYAPFVFWIPLSLQLTFVEAPSLAARARPDHGKRIQRRRRPGLTRERKLRGLTTRTSKTTSRGSETWSGSSPMFTAFCKYALLKVFFSAQKWSILVKPIHAPPDLDRWTPSPVCPHAAAASVCGL